MKAHQRPTGSSLSRTGFWRRIAPFLAGASSAAVIVAACSSIAACASDEPPAPRPLTSTRGSGKRDAGAPTEEEPTLEPSMPIDPGPPATTYLGTIAETEPVTFGGEPYCEYTIALKNVRIEVTVRDDGDVIGATVKNSVFETSVPPCPHPPMDPADQTFALTTATPTPSGVSLAFQGAATNQPKTALAIDLVKTEAGWEASGSWKRTDQPPPLDWEVKAKIELRARVD